jgi:hypothetical protein
VFGPDRIFGIFLGFSGFSRVSDPPVFLFALVRAIKLILKK